MLVEVARLLLGVLIALFHRPLASIVMRQRKSAIAEAREQKCMACFVMLRPQIWQEIRTNEQVITCNSCGRILYFDPASEVAPEPEPAKKKTKARAAVEAETETEHTHETTPTQ